MNNLEPSYLRYIYDGLDKGELHPDNAAGLPLGLTGLYEAAWEKKDQKNALISLNKALEMGYKDSIFFTSKKELEPFHSKILKFF